MGKTAAGNLAATTAAVTFVVLAAMAGSAFAAAETVNPGATAAGPSQPVGTFTGEYVNGVPVYRLAPVTVSMSRAAALAAIEQEDMAAAARSEQVPASAFHATTAAPATGAPDRNIALDVALAAVGTFVAIGLSFGLAAGRRRRATATLAPPRQWVAAQPFVPATDAPAPAADPRPLASPAPRAAVSLTAHRASEQRERRLAARRRADTSQPDAA